MEIKINKRALIAALDAKFSRVISASRVRKTHKVIKTFHSEDKKYALIAFDLHNDKMFNELLKIEQEKFLKLDSLNTIQLFYFIEIRTAKEHQKQFPDHNKYFVTQDVYYFYLLQKWIDTIRNAENKQIKKELNKYNKWKKEKLKSD
jgi:hypothetical protein